VTRSVAGCHPAPPPRAPELRALHGGCRTNRSEIKRVNVPWDATMQETG
jgi:hypothetical protein